MRIVKQAIIGLGLVGLLGCGDNALISEQAESTGGTVIEQKRGGSTFQTDCSVSVEQQRSALFNDYPLLLYGTEEERRIERDQKRQAFGKTVPDLAMNVVNAIPQMGMDAAQSFYVKAKNLAGCMDPHVNFDQEIVRLGYQSAKDRVERGSKDLAQTDIDFANGIATQAGIDVKPYATPVVEAAYQSAKNRVERGYKDLAQTDIDFAKGIAIDANLPEQIATLNALEATLN